MSTAFVVNAEALPAWHSLGGVLTALAEEGRTTPCQMDPAPFVSDRYTERREAAEACTWCPALVACRRFADTQVEVWHVWGGVDRTPTTGIRKKAA